jgi:rod shape-determining protein MreD
MRKSLFIVLVVLAFLVESRVTVYGARLNITVLFAYYVGLRHGALRGTAFGAVLGLLADSIAGNILGPNMLAMGTVGYLAPFFTRGVFTWTPFLGFLAVLVLTVIGGIISFASMTVFAHQPAVFPVAFSAMLIQGIVNSLAGPFLRPGDEKQ